MELKCRPHLQWQSVNADHVFQSPSLITVDRYYSGHICIGGDTQTDISYSPLLQRNE